MTSPAASAPFYLVPPQGFALRMMTINDLPQVLAIENEAQLTPWHKPSFINALAVEDVLPVVLHQDQVVAYGVLKIAREEAEILNLVVAQKWRRRGLGRFLIRHLIHSASVNGAESVFLEVRISNIDAQKLYEQENFTVVGKRKGYYQTESGAREDALLMRWAHKYES